ncbi:MAG: 16S rRNA (adenine(1518)-N(6)/adenine(1519)-N(6))-dimethyltransferase RsmA [Synergistaceae bacterium]|jgi:16S rRNA (adenine1518-N6/adenine1519-N6)-dimethyltransferase|nr:16S rRNA (adenine(1518)-N(6)/adenine(1519)-N(6))-dimethyltransferase RsmA [Synergistaceae bacterium]
MTNIFFKKNTDIGQNFLRDKSVVNWMIERAKLEPSDRVLEIGPGAGTLTRGILGAPCGSVDAIELDTRLKGELESLAESDNRLTLHWGDAVRFDYSVITPPTRIIANLPYHITTPLIWTLLEAFSGKGLRYMLLMTQKEVAARLASGAGSRGSGPLGVTLSCLGEVSVARAVPRGAFSPMPRVDSAILEAVILSEKPDIAALPRDRAWRRLLLGSFAQRRKTLANNWSASFGMSGSSSREVLSSHSLSASARPEELPVETWLALRRDEKLSGFLS